MEQKIKSTLPKNERWEIAPQASPERLAKLSAYPKAVAKLLISRGITTAAEAERFLAPDYARDSENPAGLKDLPEAMKEIRAALQGNKQITIHGDYDADGLTATALLTSVLRRLGGQVSTFIPDRYEDGYGVTERSLAAIREQGADLVITVDCGIASAVEIATARKGSLKVIVTDHHEPPPDIPEAEAVVNPRRPGDAYPNKHLTGAGVAFKLAQALLAESGLPAKEREATEKWLLDLVAIGTIADLAPLTGENRALVHFGLTVLRKSPRPGLRALLATAGVNQDQLSAGTVGFAIAPRLNAIGRLGNAAEALELLLAEDPAVATGLAQRLEIENQQRRELTATATAEAVERLGRVTDDQRILFVAGPWKSGIVGLVAGRLCQTYRRPAVVLGEQAGSFTGSARSTDDFHITDALAAHRELLERFGGHAQAAGLTVAADKVANLKAALQEFAGQRLTTTDFTRVRQVDGEVAAAEVDALLSEYLDRFEPCGAGNPRPALLLRGVRVVQASLVGADSRHLKLQLQLPDGRELPAIAFGSGERREEAGRGSTIDVVGRPTINEWQGRKSLEWRIDGFRRA